jgi:hypothetical protein
MEVPMPYQHCPSCRLTVHLDGQLEAGSPCPRCGTTLGDEPRSLFADALPTGRFARARSNLTPDAVRAAMSRRRGRFGGGSLSGRA